MEPKKLDGVQQVLAWLVLLDLLLLASAYLVNHQQMFRECFHALIALFGVWFCWEVRNKRFWQVIGVVLAAAWLLQYAIPSAHAAEDGPMGEFINRGDAASAFLCSTVGDPVGLFGCAGTETAIWPVLKTFNLAVFSFAALWMIWVIVSSTINSAASGVFLGKGRSGTWVPLRITVGFAMLTPAFNGWNLAQLVMLWATAVGSGIAGSVAVPVIEKMNWGAIYSAPSVMRAISVEQDLVEGIRCVRRWQELVSVGQKEATEDPDILNMKWGLEILNEPSAITINMGNTNGVGGYLKTECGQVVITLPSTQSKDAGVAQIVTAVQAAIVTEMPGLADSYKKIIEETETESEQATRFAEARKHFDSTLSTAVKIIVATANAVGSDVIKADIKQNGWLGLGFQGMHVTKAAYELTQGVQTEVKKTKAARERPDIQFTVSNIKEWFEALLNNALNDFVDRIGRSVAESISAFSGQNPISAMQGLGVSLLSWVVGLALFILAFPLIAAGSAALLAAGAALPLVGGAAQTAATIVTGSVQSVTAGLISIFMTVGIPIAFFGLKLAAYIPFLIAIMWAGAVMAWLMIVFEALLGAPLWALVHLDVEGEGMGQKTAHGYLFLLNLLFRPIILVFSLAAAMLAMNAVFALLGGGIGAMLTDMSSRSDAWLQNLVMIVGAVLVIVMSAESIITQSLSFLWNIPNNVFTWLGGQFGSNVGQGMEGAGNAAGAAIQGAGGAASGMVGASVARGQAAKAQAASAKQAGAESAQMDARFDGLGATVRASAPPPPPPPPPPNRPLHNKNRKG